MRWKLVLVVGLVAALALLAAAKVTMQPHADSPVKALPLYLAWAAVAAVGITLAAAWLLVVADTPPRAPTDVARAIVVLAGVLMLFAIGEGAIYVDRHPAYGMCIRRANGRAQCYQQPNRPEAERHAAELFLGGSAIVVAMGTAAFAAIRRTRPAVRAA